MGLQELAVWLLAAAGLVRESLQGEFQRKLYKDLLKNYNPLERPVANDSQPLTVYFTLSLMQIMDVPAGYIEEGVQMQVVTLAGPIYFLGSLLEVLCEYVNRLNHLRKGNPDLTIETSAHSWNAICMGPQVGRKCVAAISGVVAREGRDCD